jgi:hypothetical protein
LSREKRRSAVFVKLKKIFTTKAQRHKGSPRNDFSLGAQRQG